MSALRAGGAVGDSEPAAGCGPRAVTDHRDTIMNWVLFPMFTPPRIAQRTANSFLSAGGVDAICSSVMKHSVGSARIQARTAC